MHGMTEAEGNRRPPSRVVTVLGAFGALLCGLLLFVLGANEYLFPSWGRYVALAAGLAVALAVRAFGKQNGHEFAFTLLALSLYNAHLSLGGFTYLGWAAPVVFSATVAVVALFFRRRTWLWRVLAGLNVAFLVGLVMVMAFRDFTFLDDQDRCRAEAEQLPSFVHRVDGPMHPYDFGGRQGGETLGVAFGFEPHVYLLHHDGPRLERGDKIERGVQRVTPHPVRAELALPIWAQWGAAERLVLVDSTTAKVVGEVPVPGCRNVFEAAFFGGHLYALCEVSHSLHEFEAEPPYRPLRSLTLPGMDKYDLAIDEKTGRAYVTDWFSPFLVEVDLETMRVTRRRWVGFSSFGVTFGPDGRLYVAQMFLRRVVVLDPENLEVTEKIAAGYGPRDLDFDPGRKLVLVGNYFDGTVDVVTLADGKRIARFFAGELLRGLWYDQTRDRLYLATGCGVKWCRLAEALPGS
jgi:hypothetical protein